MHIKVAAAFLAFLSISVLCSCEKQPDYAAIAKQRQQEVRDSLAKDTTSKQGSEKDPVSDEDTSPYIIPHDLYLYYAGNSSRNPYRVDKDRAKMILSYTDRKDSLHWLFDGVLLLELKTKSTTAGKAFYPGSKSYDGYYLQSATKTDWENLLDYLFSDEKTGVMAFELAAEEIAKKLGDPAKKIAIYVMIPTPIVHQSSDDETSPTVYWGNIDGKSMNFAKDADRITVCEWWMDEVRRRFSALDCSYLKLSGFYWLSEYITEAANVVMKLGDYCDDNNLAFTWIPYYHAKGYSMWKTYGFTFSYYQPNYYFSSTLTESRLTDACTEAAGYGMGMEVEFDSGVISSDDKAARFRAYLDVYKDRGIWKTGNIAYYASVPSLKESASASGRDLYYEFCDWVIERPCRDSH